MIKEKYLNTTAMSTPFYKRYGITMAEAGRRMGVSKESIRMRWLKGKDPMVPHPRAEIQGRFTTIASSKKVVV